jgi:hypothetical protein
MDHVVPLLFNRCCMVHLRIVVTGTEWSAPMECLLAQWYALQPCAC